MKNLLNNPWVVGGLCVLAIITVYFRLFDSKTRPEPAIAVAQTPIVSNVAPEPSPVPSSQVNIAKAVDSSDLSPAPIIDVGWPEKFVRDPFQSVSAIRFRRGQDREGDDQTEQEEELDDPESDLRLHAVFLEGPTKLAMINRRLVKEGEQVHGYVVARIEREQVRLKGKEDLHVLEFSGSPTTQPSEQPVETASSTERNDRGLVRVR